MKREGWKRRTMEGEELKGEDGRGRMIVGGLKRRMEEGGCKKEDGTGGIKGEDRRVRMKGGGLKG